MDQLRMFHFNIALAERMLLARKRGAHDPRDVPVCSRSGLTYYLQGEGFRALSEEGWSLDAAAARLAGTEEMAPRVRQKLSRFLTTALEAVRQSEARSTARWSSLQKAFAKLPQAYEKDLARFLEEYERGHWS